MDSPPSAVPQNNSPAIVGSVVAVDETSVIKWPRSLFSLQAGRGISALLVVLTHSAFTVSRPNFYGLPWFDKTFAFTGVVAVCFFFVLSGFIIWHAHAGDIGRMSALPNFLVRRVQRVYPLYWFAFIGASAVAFVLPSLRSMLPPTWTVWLAALTLTPMDPSVVGGSGAPVLVVAWTLQFEVVFYAMFALSIVHRYFLHASALLIVIARFSCADRCSFPISYISRDYMLMFFFGIVVAWVAGSRLSNTRHPRRGLAIMVAGVLLAICASPLVVAGSVVAPLTRELLYGCGSALVILGCVWAELGGIVVGGNRLMQLLGAASYSIYLVHFPTLSLIGKIVRKIQGGAEGYAAAWICVFVMVCVSVAAGIIMHVLVEAPLARYFASRRKVAHPQVTLHVAHQ
ncbi:MAG: acyltransferase family protein [Gemmatimonas sp.]